MNECTLEMMLVFAHLNNLMKMDINELYLLMLRPNESHYILPSHPSEVNEILFSYSIY